MEMLLLVLLTWLVRWQLSQPLYSTQAHKLMALCSHMQLLVLYTIARGRSANGVSASSTWVDRLRAQRACRPLHLARVAGADLVPSKIAKFLLGASRDRCRRAPQAMHAVRTCLLCSFDVLQTWLSKHTYNNNHQHRTCGGCSCMCYACIMAAGRAGPAS